MTSSSSPSPVPRLRSRTSPSAKQTPSLLFRHKHTHVFIPSLWQTLLLFIAALLITGLRRYPLSVHAAPTRPLGHQPANTPLAKAIVSAWSFFSSAGRKSQSPSQLSAAPLPALKPSPKSFSPQNFPSRRPVSSQDVELKIPEECILWRRLARVPSKLKLYRRHFNSLDVTDWFVYTAIFDEKWHSSQVERPIYLDIAANHARRWSSTWFFDRCMGWDGICVEPNPKYWEELRTERHCNVVPTCLSDRQRLVNFSFTDAFGGVVAQQSSSDVSERFGVNAKLHKLKYAHHFHGVREISCTTVDAMMDNWRTASSNLNPKQHIDFMSLDVEGHEFPILQGINWNRTEIDVIVTENRSPPVVSLLKALRYDHFPGVLKDHLWIHRQSKLTVNSTVLSWMRSFDRKNYVFRDTRGEDTFVGHLQ